MRNKKNSTFFFNGYVANVLTGKAEFYYTIHRGLARFNFTETLSFPVPECAEKIPQELIDVVFKNVMLMLGISYWKTYCPAAIEIRNNWLTKNEAKFWNIVYTKGLGEFFYKNKIDFRELIQFPHILLKNKLRGIQFSRQKRSLLLFGGGKDSIVSGELLRRAKKPFFAFSVNKYPLHEEAVRLLGVPHIIIQRTIDPRLITLNAKKGVFNGHVPASAIYSFVGLLAAVLYDFRYIIASHEKSANYGNIAYLGSTINHQWSKSYEFEKLFQTYVHRSITPDIHYFSPLRSFNELRIVSLFSRFKKYFPVFSSCNANFCIAGRPKKRWCGMCPKCAFVFLTLAAYIPKKEVMDIFEKNLFDDVSLVSLFESLLGMRGVKPFECVGTPDEAKRALKLIIQRGEYNNDAVISHVARRFKK